MEKEEASCSADAGATFVLASKGKWWHAGYHLTTAIVGPTILTLPYALRGLGWPLGLLSLTLAATVSFYSYYLMARVLDHCEAEGRRHIRFRELASDILGSGWMFYFVMAIQTTINMGIGVGCILLAGQCVQIMYQSMVEVEQLKLYHFIIMVAIVMVVLSQLPSFHSLRYISMGSLVLSLGYSICVVVACIIAGSSDNLPKKTYTLSGSSANKMWRAFSSLSILGTIFGNGILPEIQATLAPPARGKMLKGLCMCYAVIAATFYPVAVTGYWAFGNTAQANLLNSLAPDEGPALAPTALVGSAVVMVLLQLFAIALVYSQVAYEIMENKSADTARGVFSLRNVVPRFAVRTLYIAVSALVAAMLPFFGDINSLIGAIGFIPLDFIFPMLLYNLALRPPKWSVVYTVNVVIMVVFSAVGVMGAIASVRQIAIDAHRFRLFSSHAID